MVSIDLSKAFDTIPHGLLLPKRRTYGLNDRACELFRDYLSGRLERVKVGDTYSEWQSVKIGVPQGSMLGPMFFNIFTNDLFYHITQVKLNGYADDQQLYDSYADPEVRDSGISHEVSVVNASYHENGMIVNPDKHHAMVIGNTEHSFSFPLKPSIKLLGITVDNKLAFDDHVSQVCKKINNQINVIIRNKKLIGSDVILELYKDFIPPHFQYCSSVWHFCSSRNTDKLESLNKRVLRAIFNDWNSNYNELLNKSGTISIFNQRICNMLTSVFKCLHYNSYPLYMKDMFNVRTGNYSLR